MSGPRQTDNIRRPADRHPDLPTPSLRSRIEPRERRSPPHRQRRAQDERDVGQLPSDKRNGSAGKEGTMPQRQTLQDQRQGHTPKLPDERSLSKAKVDDHARTEIEFTGRRQNLRNREDRERDYQRQEAELDVERQKYHDERKKSEMKGKRSPEDRRSSVKSSQDPAREAGPTWRNPQYRSEIRQQREVPRRQSVINDLQAHRRNETEGSLNQTPGSRKRTFDDLSPPRPAGRPSRRADDQPEPREIQHDRKTRTASRSSDGAGESNYPSHTYNVRHGRSGPTPATAEQREDQPHEDGRKPFSLVITSTRPKEPPRGRPRFSNSRSPSPMRRHSRESSFSNRRPEGRQSGQYRQDRDRYANHDRRSSRGSPRRSVSRSPFVRYRGSDGRDQRLEEFRSRRSRSRSYSPDRSYGSPRQRRRSPSSYRDRQPIRNDESRSPNPASRDRGPRRQPLPDQSVLLAEAGYGRKPTSDFHSQDRGDVAYGRRVKSDQPRIASRDTNMPASDRSARAQRHHGDSPGNGQFPGRDDRRAQAPQHKTTRGGDRRQNDIERNWREDRNDRNIDEPPRSNDRYKNATRSIRSIERSIRQHSPEPRLPSKDASPVRRTQDQRAVTDEDRRSPNHSSPFIPQMSASPRDKAPSPVESKMTNREPKQGQNSVSLSSAARPDSSDGRYPIKRGPLDDRSSSPQKRSKVDQAHHQFETPESISTPHSARLLKYSSGRRPGRIETQNTSTPGVLGTPSISRGHPVDGSVYERIGQVGEGTYGKVYKARHRFTNELVALKRIRMEQEKDGFPITSVREIKLLQRLKHPGVVRLLEMMIERGSVHMVFEYMDHDLTGVLANSNVNFEARHIKDLASQLFEGLAYLHHRGVLHRDIKGSNILLNNAGQLKLADFGLARFYHKSQIRADYTNRVITLWFRPPELLLGATAYDAAVDIWSAGCILIELFTKSTIFPGRDEIHQLETIYTVMGSPTPENWPTVTSLPWFELIKFATFPPQFASLHADRLTPAALSLSQEILSLDPSRRPLASEILQHPYFTTELPKSERLELSGIKESHEWDTKQRRRDERARKGKIEEEERKALIQPDNAALDMTQPQDQAEEEEEEEQQETTAVEVPEN